MAELRGYPDGDVERDDDCCNVQRGCVIDPGGTDEDRRGHDSHEPSEEYLLGGGQPVVQLTKRLL